MKARHLAQWWEIVLETAGWEGWEAYRDSVHGEALARLIAKMVLTLLAGRGRVSRREWRSRLRGCWRCPVYARRRRQCLVVDSGLVYGCGCWVPLMAMVRKPYRHGCWWREFVGQDGGWE